MCTQICKCTLIYMCIHTYVHVHSHAHIYACAHIYTCAYTIMRTYVWIYTHVNTYTHTHMHIHIHACTNMYTCTTHTGSHNHRQVHPICVYNKTHSYMYTYNKISAPYTYTPCMFENVTYTHTNKSLYPLVRLYAPGVSMCESICVHTHVYVRGSVCVCTYVRRLHTHPTALPNTSVSRVTAQEILGGPS